MTQQNEWKAYWCDEDLMVARSAEEAREACRGLYGEPFEGDVKEELSRSMTIMIEDDGSVETLGELLESHTPPEDGRPFYLASMD